MATTWEIDFYSRPILDENGKKKWELLICESPKNIEQTPDSLFKYSKYCSSTTVNSLWLRENLEKAMSEAPDPPKKIRFFRRQMNNMITKACNELDITPVPSRRTYALDVWFEERNKNVYPNEEGYDMKAANSASVQYPAMNATPLPDAVKGDRKDKWTFVALEASEFLDMNEWDIGFKEAFPLSMVGVTPEMKIPGLIMFSPRALPLAGWISGLDLGFLQLEMGNFPKMRLETGVSDSWILANLTNSKTLAEAKEFQEAKENACQVHFLAIQSSPESQSFAGFWLLKGSL